jgi:hypothetical protein
MCKRSWPNLRYYPGICMEGLRKTTKPLSRDSRSPGRDLNPGPPEYEGVLITRPRRSVWSYRLQSKYEIESMSPFCDDHLKYKETAEILCNNSWYRILLSSRFLPSCHSVTGNPSDVIQTLIYVNRCLSLSFNTHSSVFGIYKPYHHAAIQQQIIEEIYDVTSFSFHAMNLVISGAIFP